MLTSALTAASVVKRGGLLLTVYTALALVPYVPAYGGPELYPFASFNLYRRPFRTAYQMSYRCAAVDTAVQPLWGARALLAVRPEAGAATCERLAEVREAACASCGSVEVGWALIDFRELARGGSLTSFEPTSVCPCRD